jgi:type I restriction enzyme M protein
MDYKNLLTALGFSLKENICDVFAKQYPQADGYCLEVDFEKNTIDYGNLIQSDSKITQIFPNRKTVLFYSCLSAKKSRSDKNWQKRSLKTLLWI